MARRTALTLAWLRSALFQATNNTMQDTISSVYWLYKH